MRQSGQEFVVTRPPDTSRGLSQAAYRSFAPTYRSLAHGIKTNQNRAISDVRTVIGYITFEIEICKIEFAGPCAIGLAPLLSAP